MSTFEEGLEAAKSRLSPRGRTIAQLTLDTKIHPALTAFVEQGRKAGLTPADITGALVTLTFGAITAPDINKPFPDKMLLSMEILAEAERAATDVLANFASWSPS